MEEENELPIIDIDENSSSIKKDNSGLITRIKSAIILMVIALSVLYAGGFFFTFMMAICAAIAVQEWGNMCLKDKKNIHKNLILMAAIFSALAVIISSLVGNPAMTLWILFAFCFFLFSFNLSHKGAYINKFLFGIIYISFSIEVMIWIRNVSDYGLYNMLTLLMIVWASDISAYFAGKTFGGAKLAPSISPKKTWSGFIGSSVGAAIAAAFLASPFILTSFNLETLGNISIFSYAVMGFILAMFGQAGDLFISLFKRHYGVKDTGNLIPGHGGILDRIDALILVAMVFGSIAMVLQ